MKKKKNKVKVNIKYIERDGIPLARAHDMYLKGIKNPINEYFKFTPPSFSSKCLDNIDSPNEETQKRILGPLSWDAIMKRYHTEDK